MSKKIKVIIGVVVVLGILVYMLLGKAIFNPNIKGSDNKVIYIPTDAGYDDVKAILLENDVLINHSTFEMVAGIMKYKDNIRPGKYILKPGYNNRQIITKLRSGNQDAQDIVINNIRLLNDLAGKVSRYLESDSIAFLNYLSDPNTANSLGFNQDNFLTMFIPNTYEMFWTTKPEKFVSRMKKEYDKFWTNERKAKLKKNNIDPTQAYIIASIVDKESNYDPERPRIAGVYLNRLKSGEKLQADPTVVYATGDFSIQRVLYSHLKTDSPYNTYMYAGLPPGPICMPSLASLEAVINAEDHNYMFFCAKADNSGIHAFAETYSEHQKNADAFAAWMNSLNIK